MNGNQQNSNEIERYKVILLGDSGVGKTSLCSRQTANTFEFKMNPTIGSSHIKSRVTVHDQTVELMIWDTAGQEQFASLVPLFSRDTAVCIIVASVVNTDSCNHIMTWAKRLQDSGENPPLIVAINKIDLVEEQTLSVDEIRAKFAPDIQDIFLTSARTGAGIDQLFQQVAATARISHIPPPPETQPQEVEETPTKSSCC